MRNVVLKLSLLAILLSPLEIFAYNPIEAIYVFQAVMAKKVGKDLAYRKVQIHRGADTELWIFPATGQGCSIVEMNGKNLIVSKLAINKGGRNVPVKTWCAERDNLIANKDSLENVTVLEDDECGIRRY